MCGIFFCKDDKNNINNLKFIQHRGPDSTDYKIIDNFFLGFHRLAINGLNNNSNQPLENNNVHLICNGEIYNYKELSNKYNITLKTDSDCEIILHLYQKIGLKDTIKILDGVFAFVLYDANTKTYYIARDPFGIRSLYYSKVEGDMIVCSEMKGIHKYGECTQFPPGHFYSS